MSSDDEAAAWLRAAITDRLELAREAATPGDLRGTGARLEGVWETGCRCEGECRSYPSCEEVTGDAIHIYSEGGHDSWQAEHIVANDPRDTIARCESELGILDEHQPIIPVSFEQEGREWQECRECGPNNNYPEIYAVPGKGEAFYPCRTVRLLLHSYRFRPGYRQEWAPA